MVIEIVLPIVVAIVLCFILGKVYCCVKRRRRSSRPLTPRVRAGEFSQQPVPHRPETSSRFTDRVPPYTLPPSNTEDAPPSYEESLCSATFPLAPSMATVQSFHPQHNSVGSSPLEPEILLVPLPSSHGDTN